MTGAILALVLQWFTPPDVDAPEEGVPLVTRCDAWSCSGSASGAWVDCTCEHYDVVPAR